MADRYNDSELAKLETKEYNFNADIIKGRVIFMQLDIVQSQKRIIVIYSVDITGCFIIITADLQVICSVLIIFSVGIDKR